MRVQKFIIEVGRATFLEGVQGTAYYYWWQNFKVKP